MKTDEALRAGNRLQDLVNRWATKYYSLTMNDRQTVKSLQKFCLEEGERCPINDLDELIVIAGFIGFLEVRLAQGWRIEVSCVGSDWNIAPVITVRTGQGGQSGSTVGTA